MTLSKNIVKTAHQGGRVSPLDHGLIVGHSDYYSNNDTATNSITIFIELYSYILEMDFFMNFFYLT